MTGPKLEMLTEAVHERGPRLHLARDLLNRMLLLGIQLDGGGDVGVVIRIPEELFEGTRGDPGELKMRLLDAIHEDVTRQLAIIALEYKEGPTWPKR